MFLLRVRVKEYLRSSSAYSKTSSLNLVYTSSKFEYFLINNNILLYDLIRSDQLVFHNCTVQPLKVESYLIKLITSSYITFHNNVLMHFALVPWSLG